MMGHVHPFFPGCVKTYEMIYNATHVVYHPSLLNNSYLMDGWCSQANQGTCIRISFQHLNLSLSIYIYYTYVCAWLCVYLIVFWYIIYIYTHIYICIQIPRVVTSNLRTQDNIKYLQLGSLNQLQLFFNIGSWTCNARHAQHFEVLWLGSLNFKGETARGLSTGADISVPDIQCRIQNHF